MLKAVLFDMDGVLVDSEPEYTRIEILLCLSIGFTLTQEQKDSFVGGGTLNMWKELQKKFGFSEDPEKMAEAETRIMEQYYNNGPIIPIRPSIDLLCECAKSGIKVAIATSSDKQSAAAVAQRLGIEGYVEIIVSGDMAKSSKPAPDIFLLAARLLKVSPNECAVIEDSKSGVSASKAAGMKAVGFKTPGSAQELSAADIVVPSLSEISVMSLCALFDI